MIRVSTILALVLATAPASAQKLNVYLTLDGSGSMIEYRWLQSRALLRQLVNDPVVGGSAVVYGYQEWSTSRTGNCVEQIYVPLVNEINHTAAITHEVTSPVDPGYSSNLGPALLQLLADYQSRIIPNDPEPCRKRYVLVVTDAGWNCGSNPCLVANQLGAAGIRIIAVAAPGMGAWAVQCLATASGGTTVARDNSLEKVRNYLLAEMMRDPVSISPSTLPVAVINQPYQAALNASGGTAPHSFQVVAGALPPGISLAPSGLLSGSGSSPGSYPFTVQAESSQGCLGNQDYTLNVRLTDGP